MFETVQEALEAQKLEPEKGKEIFNCERIGHCVACKSAERCKSGIVVQRNKV